MDRCILLFRVLIRKPTIQMADKDPDKSAFKRLYLGGGGGGGGFARAALCE